MKVKEILLILCVYISIPHYGWSQKAAIQEIRARHITEVSYRTDLLLLTFKGELLLEQRQSLGDKLMRWGKFASCKALTAPNVSLLVMNSPLSENEFQQLIEDIYINFSEVQSINRTFTNTAREWAGILPTFLLRIKQGTSISSIQEDLKKTGAKLVYAHPFIERLFIFETNRHSLGDAAELAAYFRLKSSVEYAEPNLLYSPIVHTTDPLFSSQWALENTGSPQHGNGISGADISIREAWEITRGDSNIKVAIVDSGVDFLHHDLADNMLPGFDATNQGSVGFPATTFPQDAHGTAVAGIVGAIADNNLGVTGVAPECRMIPVRMFHYQDGGQLGIIPFTTEEWVLNALAWIRLYSDADILSSSVGLPDIFIPAFFPDGVESIEQAMLQMVQDGRGGKGMPVFFSSGNDDAPAPLWPSRLPYVISVTATSMCDERKSPTSCDGENWGGNYGDSLDIGAPGVMIYTTDFANAFGYELGDYTSDFNGTSAACPHAAGVMALILSVNPSLSLFDARTILETTCDQVGGYDYSTLKASGMWSQELGYGRVNAHQAVLAASQTTSTDMSMPYDIVFPEVFPNPLSSASYLSITTPEFGDLELLLFDSAGRMIYTKKVLALEKGAHKLELSELQQSLADGIYILRITGASYTFNLKIVAQNE